MRAIKFRAWEKKLPYMHDDVFIDGSGNVYTSASKTFNTPNTEIERRDDLIVMQFTGLKDANGVDIYEGDILNLGASLSNFNCVVGYDESQGSFRCRNVNESEYYSEHIYGANICVVIGNIHQHPELLEKAS